MGVSPITYGDTIEDDFGKLQPKETVLTHPDDHLSKQSLDYIFWVRRRNQIGD